MITLDYTHEQSSVYPGEYEPADVNEKEWMAAVTAAKFTAIPVMRSDLPGCYKIELAIPGFKHEDFMVFTEDHVLTIIAVDGNAANTLSEEEKELQQSKILTGNCVKRNIKLPADTDPVFVDAAYNNGILSFCFYKTNYPGDVQKNRVVVH